MHSLRHVAWLRGLEALQQCRGHFVTQFCICAASICCLCKFVPHNLSVGGRWGRCGLSRICTAEAPSADFVVAPSSFVRSVSAIYACEIDVERCLGRDPVVGRCLRGYGRHGSHVYPCCPMAWRHFCSSVVQGLFQSECGRLIGSFANSFACVAVARISNSNITRAAPAALTIVPGHMCTRGVTHRPGRSDSVAR